MGRLVQAIGGIVFLSGLGLFVGNVTGIFPTIPMAGYLVMAAGLQAILEEGVPRSRATGEAKVLYQCLRGEDPYPR